MTALLDRILELNKAATLGPWAWFNSETDAPIDFKAIDPSIVAEYQDTHIGGRLSLRTTWEEGEGWQKLPKFIVENEEGGLKADHDLIATYRTAAPALARALKIALDALDDASKASVMHSRDAGDCIIDRHKDDAGDALAAIAKELEGV